MRVFLLLMALPAMGLAQLNPIRKCALPDGRVTYTDKECPSEAKVEALEIDRAAEENRLKADLKSEHISAVCSALGETGGCYSRQGVAMEWVERMLKDKRDGPAVETCMKRWRIPGSKLSDYSMVRVCTTTEVAVRNR